MSGVIGPERLPFDAACREVVEHLKAEVPLACWSVSRFDGEHQVHLCVDDDVYGLRPGAARPWSETFCRYMVDGLAPQLAPDATAVPQYVSAAAAAGMDIRAYAGVPIRDGDGTLFGTLCGFDPEVQDDELLRHGPLLHVMAALLGQMAQVERRGDDAVAVAKELRRSARHDPVTALTVGSEFLDELTRVALTGDDVCPRQALVLLRPGVLGAVNDAHGHAAGDCVLAEVAGRLAAALHPFDTVARLVGEEFAVLIHDAAGLPETTARIDDALDAPVVLGDLTVALDPTAGVVLVGGADPGELLARARSARAPGGPRWSVHDPATNPGVPALRAALRSGAIEAVYQPVVDLLRNRVVGFEALARWTHAGVEIRPDVFVPLAARAGLQAELTDHMLDLATAQVAGWSAVLGHRRLKVGVNVPPALLLDTAFPDRVAERVRRHGLAPRQLVLEVTEDALLDDLPRARAVADRVCALGVMLCLDDVGAGYSSLLHLRHLPFHLAKVDRAFVMDVDSDPESRRFLGAVLACGRELGLRVVAEGVERASQLDVLRGLGVDLVQGHHLGRPTRPADVDVRLG